MGGSPSLWFGRFLGFLRSKVWVDFQRTVPIRVGKQTGHIAEVHDREVGLTLLLPQAGATADDLLELCHGADHLVQNDQLDHLAVGPGGEQLRRCGDDRALRGCGDKILQFALAVGIAPGDPHHIVRVLLHHIGVEVDQRHPHPLSGILIGTEYNGLGHTVGAFEVAGDLSSHLLDAVFDDDVIVVVAVGVNAVRDLIAVDIPLALAGTPAVPDVGHDVDDLERRQEAVVNALFQTVGIDRVSEIAQIGDVFCLFRCGSHADLGGVGEVLQNPPPAAFLLGRAPVALIHDDQVKEVGREELTEVLLVVVSHQLLVEGEVHLVGGDGAGVIFGHIDLVSHLLQRGEVLLDGLIHQNIAVRQIEHLALHAAFQEPIDDLKGGVGLSGSGGHHQQKSLLPLGNGVHRPIDGDPLVVPGRISILAGIVGLVNGRFLRGAEAGFLLEAGGQLCLRGEFIQAEFPLCAGEKIVLGKAISIGTERKGQIQHSGVLHRLL